MLAKHCFASIALPGRGGTGVCPKGHTPVRARVQSYALHTCTTRTGTPVHPGDPKGSPGCTTRQVAGATWPWPFELQLVARPHMRSRARVGG